MRQVQVARDAILHLLDDAEPGLTEEDVLVVCPDLERFAPLVEAVFGPPGSTDAGRYGAPALRYRIADRSIRSANPVLGATAALLDLVAGTVRDRPGARLPLARPGARPVRVRRVRPGACSPSGRPGPGCAGGSIPYTGPGSASRPTVVGNTWQAALDRLLLGSAVTEAELDLAIGGVAPFGVDSGDTELLGSFGVRPRPAGRPGRPRRSDRDRTVAGWVGGLRRACDDLFAAPDRAGVAVRGARPGARRRRGCRRRRRGAGSDGARSTWSTSAASSRVGSTASPGAPTSSGAGSRSRRWPRCGGCRSGWSACSGSTRTRVGSVGARRRRPGRRRAPDRRSRSRGRSPASALLEAVLAAGDHLLVVRDGRDVRSNHAVPQVVPAAELFDAVVALVRRGGPAGDARVAGGRPPPPPLRRGSAWSPTGWLVRTGLELRRSATCEAAAAPAAAARPRTPVPRPAARRRTRTRSSSSRSSGRSSATRWRTFVRRTLEARLPRRAEEVDDVLPVELDGLETYRVGQELLDARLQGDATTTSGGRSSGRRGRCRPGVLEDAAVRRPVRRRSTALIAEGRARGVRPGDAGAARGRRHPRRRDADRRHGPPGLDGPDAGSRPRPCSPGRSEVHRLEAWLDLMALTAAEPGRPWRSVVVDPVRSAARRRWSRSTWCVPPPVATTGRHGAGGASRWSSTSTGAGCASRSRCSPRTRPRSTRERVGTRRGRVTGGRGDGTRPAVRLVFGDVDADEIYGLEPSEGDPGGDGRPGRALRRATCGERSDATVGAPGRDRPPSFDVLGALPDGAGGHRGQCRDRQDLHAGRRWPPGILAERDIAPSELLIVTFTRAATAELRSRIRGQLVTSAAALAGGPRPPSDDELSAFLADGDVRGAAGPGSSGRSPTSTRRPSRPSTASPPRCAAPSGMSPADRPRRPADVGRRRAGPARLRRRPGRRRPPAASPSTSCPTLSDLVDGHRDSTSVARTWSSSRRPDAAGATPEQIAAPRAGPGVAGQSRRTCGGTPGTMGFDDVLDPAARRAGRPAVGRGDRRPPQPVQGGADRRVPGHRPGAVGDLLDPLRRGRTRTAPWSWSGDPKQAIYRFRGADISVYLDAVAVHRRPTERFTLGTNWRSDGAAIEAMHALLRRGDVRRRRHRLRAGRARRRPTRTGGMTGAGGRRALRASTSALAVGPSAARRRRKRPDHAGRPGSSNRTWSPTSASLLDTASIPDDGGRRVPRASGPSDIAVLVTSGEHARRRAGRPPPRRACRRWSPARGASWRPGRRTSCACCCRPWSGRRTSAGSGPMRCPGSSPGPPDEVARRVRRGPGRAAGAAGGVVGRTSAPARWPRCWPRSGPRRAWSPGVLGRVRRRPRT